ncbi:MAG: lysophospholipid acyltransferase family protein [Bacillota bacterium]|nr:lysophospholipid acyltransferase family protein [Bacillota bacterium]
MRHKNSWLYRVARILMPPLAKLMYRYQLYNSNNIPLEGRFVIASNHVSNFDPILVSIGQKRQIYYMAKVELFKIPIVRSVVKALGAFSVTRGANDQTALNSATELLNNDHVLGVFLEGHRSKTGEFLKPHSGAVMLAYQTNSPIVPVCITPKNNISKVFRKTKIIYGDPITPAELGILTGAPKEFREASRKIMSIILQMRKEHEF